jgi:hypothetical protein
MSLDMEKCDDVIKSLFNGKDAKETISVWGDPLQEQIRLG